MLETFFNSVSSVFVILLLTATGYFLAAAGWMKAEHKAFLSKLLISVFVPCNCAYGMLNNLDRELLLASGIYLLIPFATMLISYPLSLLTARLFGVSRNHTGLFVLLTATSNAIFIGLAMCRELFGECERQPGRNREDNTGEQEGIGKLRFIPDERWHVPFRQGYRAGIAGRISA